MSDLAEALRLLGEVALVCAVVALVLRLRAVGGVREELSRAGEEVSSRDDELARLATEVLPATGEAVAADRRPDPYDAVHPTLAGTAYARRLHQIRNLHAEALADAHQQAEQATQGMLRSVARTVQGLANSQQKKITEMMRRHDDPDFVEDLLVVDHTNAQILRRSAGITVVCGSWPGRQHNATPLVDVVRGAVGRILDYRRVQIVRLEDGRAVVGRVVEGLVLTLAELLENATRYSNPSTVVQLHVQLTHNGLALVIEDAGIGLNPAERERIARMLAPDGPGPDLSRLGNPPHFGLVVCALLARRYGFSVHVGDGSAFGGVRAVVNLPSDLLTDPVPDPPRASAVPVAPAAPVPAPVPEARSQPTAPRPSEPTEAAPTTPGGLPRRVRRAPAPRSAPEPPPAHTDPVPAIEPSEASATFGGFLRGSQAAHRARPTSEGTPEV